MAQITVIKAMSSKQIEDIAYKLLYKYYPSVLEAPQPTPVEHFFEIVIPKDFGIDTSYNNLEELGVPEAEGYTNSLKKISVIDAALADENSRPGVRRFKSTVAHETGHCILHVPQRQWQLSQFIRGASMKRESSNVPAYENPEWQAWRFAQAFCMPRESVYAVIAQYGLGFNIIEILAETFDMNPAFVRNRINTLKIRVTA